MKNKTAQAALLVGAAVVLFSACAALDPGRLHASAEPTDMAAQQKPAVPKPGINALLTLDQAIAIALANNPEISAVQWDVRAAGSSVDAARALRRPTLSAVGGYMHHLDDQRLIPTRYNAEPGIFDPDIFQGDLVLKHPLFTGGRIVNEIRAAEWFRLSEEKRLSYTREELVFNVSSTFYAILGQREVIRSLAFSTDVMEAHRKQVSDLLSAQKAARVDLLRTEVRLADLRQNLVREENVLAVQKRLLMNLLGSGDDPDPVSIEGELVFDSFPAPSPEDYISAALKHRNDYLAAKARLEAQARRVDAVSAGHWPTVSLLGSYGFRAAGSGESDDTGSIGVGVSVPLFEGGRTAAEIQQERAVLAGDQERLRKLELRIRQEVEVAVLDIRSIRERIDAIRQSIRQAEESLRIERMKYNLGKGSITDVLDAQSALLQSETNYARAMADFRIAVAQLSFASGKNWL